MPIAAPLFTDAAESQVPVAAVAVTPEMLRVPWPALVTGTDVVCLVVLPWTALNCTVAVLV